MGTVSVDIILFDLGKKLPCFDKKMYDLKNSTEKREYIILTYTSPDTQKSIDLGKWVQTC